MGSGVASNLHQFSTRSRIEYRSKNLNIGRLRTRQHLPITVKTRVIHSLRLLRRLSTIQILHIHQAALLRSCPYDRCPTVISKVYHNTPGNNLVLSPSRNLILLIHYRRKPSLAIIRIHTMDPSMYLSKMSQLGLFQGLGARHRLHKRPSLQVIHINKAQHPSIMSINSRFKFTKLEGRLATINTTLQDHNLVEASSTFVVCYKGNVSNQD
jgi:hypothetical protein